MLSNIQISNLKSAKDVSARIGGLTVLSGLNGSGKSTILQAIGLIRQSHINPNAKKIDGLHLNGNLVQLGTGRDALSESAKTDSIEISITEESRTFKWKATAAATSNFLAVTDAPDAPAKFCSSPDFQFIQANRISPRTLYPQAPQKLRDENFLGAQGEYTAEFLERRMDLPIPKSRHCTLSNEHIDPEILAQIAPTGRLLDQVAAWLQQISPGAQVFATSLEGTDDVRMSYRYHFGAGAGFGSHYRPTNVGFGVTYSLPIIAACLAAPKDSLLLLENPEAHIHPQGQVAMGMLLSQTAADGAQIIVETHSDHIINGIRLASKAKLVPHDSVVFHHFTRNHSDGETRIVSPALLDGGKVSSWPSGFFDQWEKSLEQLLG